VGFVFRTVEAGKPIDERFDVSDVQGLKALLRIIDRETDQIGESLRRHRRILEHSTDRISRRLSRMSLQRRLGIIAGEIDLQG